MKPSLYTRDPWCDGCESDDHAVVAMVGREPIHETDPATCLCLDCAREAVALLEAGDDGGGE